MSKLLINQYYNDVDKIVQFSGSRNEGAIKSAFGNLLNHYAEKKNLLLVREVSARGTKGTDVIPDGTLKNILRLDYGYWESKDESDELDKEIEKKIRKGYPLTNILFEDSQTAVLFQSNEESMRINMRNPDELHRILNAFINFEKPEVRRFNEAIENFQKDIPAILKALREKIDAARKESATFASDGEKFLELCKAEINPDITEADVREMMIQHILTSDIFNKVFGDAAFHRHNNIANELEKLIDKLFVYSERKNLLSSIEHYYDVIHAAAAGIADHHEKQKFLKVLYENFYKAYNPKAADRLGVVYTPNEIVQFMVESADALLHRHFGKTLADKNVEILDPATGTGTFITSIIDHIPKQSLAYKYKNEIHANEVAILPYYVANLNIEFTFKQKMGYYEEFPNICFVDTLDNVDALTASEIEKRNYGGVHAELNFALSSENAERIKRQNRKKISVIIGNPPYNANQKNENENNKNREYPAIDKRIKDTYIKHSTAQKTKVYDMYARFYRWAADRLDKNGIIAFITNRSFIDSRTFDGFRKCVQYDFCNAYIIDTKSDVRANPKIAGTTHNVFGIQTGVALMFLVKKEKQDGECKIEYVVMEDNWRKEEKLEWLRNRKIESISFVKIIPDKNNNWINLADNDFESLLPLADKNVKLGRKKEAVFELFSLGVVTARDEWVYDNDEKNLEKKIKFFFDIYRKEQIRWNDSDKKKKINDFIGRTVKFTSELEGHLVKGTSLKFDANKIRDSLYRPFIKQKTYFDRVITHRLYQQDNIFPIEEKDSNVLICVNIGNKAFNVLGVNHLPDYHFNGDSQCLPLYRYNEKGERIDNITDWGLEQFRSHYKDGKIKKEDIFHYTYAVLHNPVYRKKYELNLKREFPRLPFYKNFRQWTEWGKALIDLHINYEDTKPFPLKEHTFKEKAEAKRQKKLFEEVKEPEPLYSYKPKVKVKLKADKNAGMIEIDELTFLTGVPKEAWDYKLGNRSALEWVLDQYKEKKPKDPTIAEKFNTYRFADYKEKVIDLLKRVCAVSVETMKIVGEMKKER